MTKKQDEFDKAYEKFINLISKDLGLNSLPDEVREEALKRISTIAQHRILQTILLAAKEEDIEEIEKEVSNTEDPKEVYKALGDKIEGLDAKINDTLSELYLNLKEEMKDVREKKNS